MLWFFMLPTCLINEDRPAGWLSEVVSTDRGWISRQREWGKKREITGTEVERVRQREDFGVADRKSITRLRHRDLTFKALHFRSSNTFSFILDKVSVCDVIIDSLEIQPDGSHLNKGSFLLIIQLSVSVKV